jgi:CheY-like chemotaxis protein
MHTLLLADDSVTTQRVVALTFAEEAFRVITVSDGQQALDAMAAMRPDIVLASTSLPRTDGYDLSAHMRGTEALRQVPVLLLSGAFESVDAARLEASGARGIIEKPLEPTVVISRVRELLGLKDATPAAQAGRLVTSADTAADKKAPPRPATTPVASKPVVSTWDELRKETGLEPDARSVEGGTPGSGREDYLDTLDAAFDSLDQHLAGRHDAQPPQRNPSGPLGQASGAADPRSPGRRPSMTTEGQSPNAVFEVDADWFSNEDRDRDRASSRDITADAHEAMPRSAEAEPATPVFEVDDEWFAAGDQARGERLTHHRELAAEMGIHDVELPAVEPSLTPAPADGLDFDFGLDDFANAPAPSAAPVVAEVQAVPAPPIEPVAQVSPVVEEVRAAAPEPISAAPAVETPAEPPSASVPPGSVADDFAALLAFETGDGPAPLPPESVAPAAPAAPVALVAPVPPVVVQAPAPEITDAMLDQIADRVVERLNTATFGADLREAMTATIRDTVRSVVSETSERLVRDEIDRIKGRVERDTP